MKKRKERNETATSCTKFSGAGAANGSFEAPSQQFTQIANAVLRDDRLSLGAKGLFSLIASYITLPGFTLYKSHIQRQCKEGRYAFDSAWKELQQAGYLSHQRVRQENGAFGYQYSLQCPPPSDGKEIATVAPSEKIVSPPTEPDPSKDLSKDSSKDLLKESFKESLVKRSEKKTSGPRKTSLRAPNETAVKPPVSENQTPVYYIYNKTLQSNTYSVSQTGSPPTEPALHHRNMSSSPSGSSNFSNFSSSSKEKKREALTEALAEQLELDYFAQEPSISQASLQVVEFLCHSLVEECLLPAAHRRLSTDQVASVDSCTVFGFLEHMRERGPKASTVYHPQAYWKAAFFNYVQESVFALACATGG